MPNKVTDHTSLHCNSPYCFGKSLHAVYVSVRSFWNQFGPYTKSAIIGGLALMFVHGYVIPTAQRRQVELDRRYKILTDIAITRGEYYQSIWKVYFGKQLPEPLESRQRYRDQLQGVSREAERIRIELSLLFKDRTIAGDWKRLTDIYWNAQYPIGQGEGQLPSQVELESRLTPAMTLLDSIISKIRWEMGY